VHLVVELWDPFADFLFEGVDLDVTILQEDDFADLLMLPPELVILNGRQEQWCSSLFAIGSLTILICVDN